MQPKDCETEHQFGKVTLVKYLTCPILVNNALYTLTTRKRPPQIILNLFRVSF